MTVPLSYLMRIYARKPTPFPLETLPNTGLGETVAQIIMAKFQTQTVVDADDIYYEAMTLVPEGTDPRFIGSGFHVLSHRGIIKPVGVKRSLRMKTNHSRPIVRWGLTT